MFAAYFVRAALLALGLTSAFAQDWPQFLGPQRNGVYAGTNLATTWPKEGPKRLWERSIGAGFAGPAVARGQVILFHRTGDNEVVESIAADSGKTTWTFPYPTKYRDDFGFDEGPRAIPTVAGDSIYTLGAEGTLHCLDFATGTNRWTMSASKDFGASKGYFGFACSPLVVKEVAIMNIGGRDGAGTVALDIRTGKLKWKATSDEASYSSPVLYQAGDRDVALVFSRSGLFGLAVADGAVIWKHFWRARMQASVNAAAPVIVDDTVFLSASYGTGATLLKLKPGGVETLWASDDSISNHYSTSVYRAGFLYGFHGRQEEGQALRCIDAKTGKMRWEHDGETAGSVVLAGDRLLVLTERGELVAVAADPAKYRELARAQVLGGKVRAFPAVANGKMYARSLNQLVALDLSKGE
jgi:outer membrane protein assembly factor BamB